MNYIVAPQWYGAYKKGPDVGALRLAQLFEKEGLKELSCISIPDEKPLRNLTFVSSIVGMCVSIPLVYYFSYIGAAVTVLFCRGLLGIGSYVLAKYINDNNLR